MRVAIWWIRRDLRLADNEALGQALARADQVVPVFVLDPVLLSSPNTGPKRLGFLFAGLHALDADLRRLGGHLVVRRGDPETVLAGLSREVGAEAVYAEADISPYAQKRDVAVARVLPLHLTGGLTVHLPDAVLKANGEPYTVYTPYSRAWRSLPLPDAEDLRPVPHRVPVPVNVKSDPLPEALGGGEASLFPAGEAEAQRRLAAFADETIYGYAALRDRMDQDGTSRLSPYLRFGMLSAQRAVVAALDAAANARTEEGRSGARAWLNELIWREFYSSILYHFPGVQRHSFREAYRSIRWDNDPEAFAAWQTGHTGYPIVDAAMRQLAATGWMHNRARMIVASFLTKDLLVDWRWGERHFMACLIDGDPAANNGGWQWSAGTGTDAAPYFRVFNPVLQGQRYDPQGDYIRRWVPELAGVPTPIIHKPWTMADDLQRQVGCVIGVDYPAPLVDHAVARIRALAAYKEAKENVYG